MTDPSVSYRFESLVTYARFLVGFTCLALLAMPGCGSEKPKQTLSGELKSALDPNIGSEPDPKPSTPIPLSREQEISSADQALKKGDIQEAIAALQRVLVADPSDVEVLFRLGTIQAQTGNLAAAVALLDSIPDDHPQAGLPSLGQSADWCLQLNRFDEAEKRYLKVIKRAPTAVVARRQLAFLLNRQGRRHEATEHVRYLCKIGDVRQDELHSLMVVNNAVFDDPNEKQENSNQRLYFPIGAGAVARKYFTDGNYDEAEEALRELVESGKAHPAHVALYGRVITESQDDERFLRWLSQTNESTKQFSEYWAAVGTYLLNARRFKEAVRALAQAIDLDPTDAPSMRRINQALLALGDQEEADKWHQRFADMRSTTLASNRVGQGDSPDLESVKTVCEGLEKLDRPLESVMWKLVEAFYRKSPAEVVQKLNDQRKSLVKAGTGYPTQNSRLCSLNIDSYPLPNIEIPDAAMALTIRPNDTEPTKVDPPAFRNAAAEIGIDHTYMIASKQQDFGFAIYQQLGGGVAVLDYDRDGSNDLYFAQGASDPPQLVSSKTNELYRGVDSVVTNVTSESAVTETLYSVGVTAGDWNQDGWEDLVVANIGGKKLLINNGDGTFSTTVMTEPNKTDLTSSIAMGDVTGDSLPDIFALHYVEDEGMFDRPEVAGDGEVLTKSPASFQPGVDRIFINDGSGGMTERTVGDDETYASTGLGVIISDLDGKPGNEVFVGNDIRANHLWKRDSESDDWNDIGSLSGCALGYGGLITASMGVAAADFDQSGTLDIHITNFLLEPVSLFMNRGGNFQDRCVPMKLARDSTPVLGFGSQPIDYNNDGRNDIAVTNGHIERPARDDEPFHQQPQLFANMGDRFKLADVADSSDYWQGKYLGRALATLDFNRDGKLDLLFSHINQPSALLINETASTNHWLQIELVGTKSERDGIGAHVELKVGDRSWHDWVNGGDGYLARNEPALHFGLGDVRQVDSVVVTWPTGEQQVVQNVDVDQRILIVEDDESVFVRFTK